MKRTTRVSTALLVEGDDDERFFRRHVDLMACVIEVCYGRPNVLGALEDLEATRTPGVVAIVDPDHWLVLGGKPSSSNLVCPDVRDIEMMLLLSEAFDRVVGELGNRELLTEFCLRHGQVRDRIFQAAKIVGCIRIHAQERSLGLRFDGLRWDRFVDAKSLELAFNAFVEELQNHSGVGVLDRGELEKAVADVEVRVRSIGAVCGGHDAVAILAVGLRKAIGGRTPSETAVGRIETDLRLAFERADLVRTELYREVIEWERRNAPFRVWKQQPDAVGSTEN